MTIRASFSNTSASARALIESLKSDNLLRLVLLALPDEPANPQNPGHDECVHNLPGLVAFAEYTLPGGIPVTVVFDNCYLSAQRPPRYGEIRDILDAAQGNPKAFFSMMRAPFTARLGDKEAEEALRNAAQVVQPLTAEKRAKFFAKLSSLNEDKLNELFNA